jgi:hypothetical protein
VIKPILTVVSAAALIGCESATPTRHEALAGVMRAEREPQPTKKAAPDSVPPVLISNTPVAAAEVNARLAEAAGSVVLEEVVLDHALAKLVAERSIMVTQKEVDGERERLLQAMREEAQLNEQQAELALNNLRRARGLGPQRFQAMLTRNAQLRALVRDSIDVTNEETERAVAIEFGPTYRVRVIRLADSRQAPEVRAKIAAALPPHPTVKRENEDGTVEMVNRPLTPEETAVNAAIFSQWATNVSEDETAPGGGLIPDFSPADTARPGVLRDAVPQLGLGELGPVYASDRAYWIALVEQRHEPKAAATPSDRERVKARLRSRKERMEMDRLARQLLATTSVSVMDPALRWSWEQRPRD